MSFEWLHDHNVQETTSRSVFAESTIKFLCTLSDNLIARQRLLHPDAVAFGDWIRPHKISRLIEEYSKKEVVSRSVYIPAGTALHVAPSNVDGLFAYSWAISVLAGNRTFVRISSRSGPVTSQILSSIDETLRETEFETFWGFFKSSHDDTQFRNLVADADALVLWGGDDSIRSILSLGFKPGAKLGAFPTRSSASIVNAREVLELDVRKLSAVVSRAAKDILLFGQQACSSPRSLVWIGTNEEVNLARKVFWNALKRQGVPHISDSEASQKRIELARLVLAGGQSDDESYFTPREVSGVMFDGGSLFNPASSTILKSVGLLRELSSSSLGAGISMLPGIQTLTYYGFKREDFIVAIRSAADCSPLRVTPLGTALDFEEKWDGLSLFETLSKTVVVS